MTGTVHRYLQVSASLGALILLGLGWLRRVALTAVNEASGHRDVLPPATLRVLQAGQLGSLKRLARERRTTVAETVARAVRVLRQDQMGHDLSAPLTDDEADWLDAELG